MIMALSVICTYKAGDSRTEPGQGGTGGVSNVPDETTPPPHIEPEQDDDISSMTWEPPRMEKTARTI